MGGETPTQMGPLDQANPNYWSSDWDYLYILYFIQDDGQIPKDNWFSMTSLSATTDDTVTSNEVHS
jgi:hypothetical protein